MATVTIAIGTTGDALPGTVILDTERCLLIAARVIVTGIASPAITGHTLTGIGVVTIIIITTADALIAVLTDDTIGGCLAAALVGAQGTGLALTEGAQRLVWVIALEISLAIAADIPVG